MPLNKLLSVLFVIVFGFSSQLAAKERPIIIGGSLGLTGKYAQMSQMKLKGFRLWEEHVNREGGLLGRKVKVVIHDDKSSTDTAKEIYRQFIEKEKVDLVLGPYSSSITGAVMPLLESKGYPLLASGAASDTPWQQGYQYLFGIFTPASRYAVGFLEMIAMSGMTQVAIVSTDDSFSTVMAEGTKKWAKRFGLEVIMNLQFKKGTRDLTDIAEQLSATGVQAVVMCGHFNEAIDLRVAFKKIHYQPIAYFASIGPAMQKYQEMLGADAEFSFSSSQWEPSLAYRPEDKAIFLIPFQEKYGVNPAYHTADAFAAGQILAAAVTKAGTLDREDIRNNLVSMNYVSIISRYGVDKTGKQIRHFPINIQWQNGEKEIIWPEELATGQPILKGLLPANN